MSLLGSIEIILIAVLALLVIGPKDLPKVLYAAGRFFQMVKKTAAGFMDEFHNIHHFSEVEEMNAKRKKDDAKTSSRTSH